MQRALQDQHDVYAKPRWEGRQGWADAELDSPWDLSHIW